ncbi:MAG: hypothetical protein KDB18_14010, partial [Salinibacterium sp.]|nr:hypothetical protein [Salinibacterium sp.]
WVFIVASVLVLFVIRTLEFGAAEVTSRVLATAMALLFGALTVLLWDLALVWVDYVGGTRDLDRLRYSLKCPPSPGERDLRSLDATRSVDSFESWIDRAAGAPDASRESPEKK